MQSETFAKWIAGLRDQRAVLRIRARLDHLSCGLAGDAKPVGEGISEARIDYGPGYRLSPQARPGFDRDVVRWRQVFAKSRHQGRQAHRP